MRRFFTALAFAALALWACLAFVVCALVASNPHAWPMPRDLHAALAGLGVVALLVFGFACDRIAHLYAPVR